MKNKGKGIYLLSGSEEGFTWQLQVTIRNNTKRFIGSFTLTDEERKKKSYIRNSDRFWVFRNIPSSIHWKNEIHHDWENGGRMYLLSVEEHRAKTKEEKKK